jgi:hypothetical protein
MLTRRASRRLRDAREAPHTRHSGDTVEQFRRFHVQQITTQGFHHKRSRLVRGQRHEMNLPITFSHAATAGAGCITPDSDGDDAAVSETVFGRHDVSYPSMWSTP